MIRWFLVGALVGAVVLILATPLHTLRRVRQYLSGLAQAWRDEQLRRLVVTSDGDGEW